MFGWDRREKERREQEEPAERLRLEALSEKELLIELMIELKRIDRKLDRVRKTVIAHGD